MEGKWRRGGSKGEGRGSWRERKERKYYIFYYSWDVICGRRKIKKKKKRQHNNVMIRDI